MIHKVECFTAECDNCGDIFENFSGYSIFADEGSMKDDMGESDWYSHGVDENYPNNHFCDKCFKYDEQIDDKIIVDLSRKKPNSDTDDERSVAITDQSGNESRGTNDMLESIKIALSYRDWGVLNEYLTSIGEKKIPSPTEPRPPKNNSEDVYRWVKASERLPEVREYYFVKDKRNRKSVYNWHSEENSANTWENEVDEWLEKITPSIAK